MHTWSPDWKRVIIVIAGKSLHCYLQVVVLPARLHLRDCVCHGFPRFTAAGVGGGGGGMSDVNELRHGYFGSWVWSDANFLIIRYVNIVRIHM